MNGVFCLMAVREKWYFFVCDPAVMLCATASALLIQCLKFQMILCCAFSTVKLQELWCYALLPQCVQFQMLLMLCTITAISVVSGSVMLSTVTTLSAVSDTPMLYAFTSVCSFRFSGVHYLHNICSFRCSDVVLAFRGYDVPFYYSVCSVQIS